MSKRHAAPALLGTALLTACAVGPNYHRPTTPVDAHFVNAGEPGFAETSAVEKYWESFQDPCSTLWSTMQ
jgi:outer membrane protein TolC